MIIKLNLFERLWARVDVLKAQLCYFLSDEENGQVHTRVPPPFVVERHNLELLLNRIPS